MKFKKRRKSGRRHGKQTAFRGAKERTRGSGNRGGYGMAGTGKRGDQKKTLVINQTGGNNYFGKDKTLRRGNIPQKLNAINLSDIENNLQSFKIKGNEIDLTGFKILGEGNLSQKLKIRASAASASAIEKVKKSGGEIILREKRKELSK
ncbi:uL15 family ribosomal protein [Candidatus Pacearchaeota archaeon]|nr:uL15 family ribosomal protein [Candidatus Pacearchaeota archaeon]